MSTVQDADDLILEALLSMVIADDDIDPDELSTLARVYGELTGRELSTAHLEAHARARLVDPTAGYPGDIGEGLDSDEKRRVLEAAFAIAAADGFVVEEEEQQLAQLAQMLGLTPEASRKAVAGLMSSRPG